MKYLREIVQLDEAKKKWPDYYIKKETKRRQDQASKEVRAQGIKDLKRKRKIGFFKEDELDEAKRTPYKRKGSLRAQVKSQADIAKEKSGRRKLAKAAIKDTKETGEKVKFRPFGRWSTKRKLKEDLQELSLQRLGAFVDKAEAEDYKKDSTKHRMGINLALRKRGEHRHTAEVPPKVRASIDGKKK